MLLRPIWVRLADALPWASWIPSLRNLAPVALCLVASACGGGGGASVDPPGSSGSTSSSSSSSSGGGTVAPSVPTGLAAASGASSVALTWVASTESAAGPGVAGYYVYRNGSQIGTVSSGTSYTDSPLAALTTYSYQVAAFDKAIPPNVSALSAAISVTTSSSSQTPATPTGLATSNITATSVTLTWNASTGVSGYFIYCNGVQIATVSSGTSYNNQGLAASTTYSYRIAAYTQASASLAYVSAPSASVGVTTAAATQPPSVPTGLSASSIATGSALISWAASTDSDGSSVGGYYVYRNGSRIATVTSGTSYADSTLSASTSYSYQVAAFDHSAPPNVSALSTALGVTTLADTQPPTIPTGLAASNVTPSTVPLSWNASTDLPVPGATGVGGYFVYRNNTLIATVTSGTSYTDLGRAASTGYSYQVAAFDKATPANVSARSAPLNVTTAASTLTITPQTAPLTLMQTQQFTTNAAGGTTLNWSVDGVVGGNSSVGTISAAGLYTPPTVAGAGAGLHSVGAVSSNNSAITGSALVAVTDLSAITTYHNDLARTGQNMQEYALTPVTVSGGTFGKLWSCPLDATAYAQPLYVANLSIGGGTHNVLFVATMNDSLYAFDADNPTCVTYWHVSFINGTTVTPQSSAAAGCGDNPGTYGITGTPVIDPVAQTIYLVTATTESGTNVQRLHALSLATGAEQPNSPAVIQATVAGDSGGGTSVVFNSLYQNQRSGLVLTGGAVVIAWGSHCDNYLWPWNGWVMAYDATALSQTAVFNDTPNGTDGGIWMSGGAPAVDAGGNMFLSTGNGSFDATSGVAKPPAPNNDYGESFLNLNPSSLAVQDFYTPSQNAAWTTSDLDISAGGITVLPDGIGPSNHPNVLVGSDKQGHLWMIDRSNMSGFLPGADNTVQYLTLPYASKYGVHSSPGYWNGTVYAAVANGPLMAFQLSGGLIPQNAQIAIAAAESVETYTYPSPTPMISASPSGGAIVWVLNNNANGTDNGSGALGPAILRAYDATNLGTTLYSSATLPADSAGEAAKFALPVVANGHVYVAGYNALTVYGLAP
jgi:chitodextrinase